MKKLKQGVLIWDAEIERYRVRYSLEEFSAGLHCGEGWEVKIGNRYVPTRIEYKIGVGYYLVGINTFALSGIMVRY